MYRDTIGTQGDLKGYLKYSMKCPQCKEPIKLIFTKKDLKYMLKAIKTDGQSMIGHKLPSEQKRLKEEAGG